MDDQIAILALINADINKMKVVDLNVQPRKRNTSLMGNKPVLKDRLETTVAAYIPLMQNQGTNITVNNVVVTFDNCAYWDLVSNNNGKIWRMRGKGC